MRSLIHDYPVMLLAKLEALDAAPLATISDGRLHPPARSTRR